MVINWEKNIMTVNNRINPTSSNKKFCRNEFSPLDGEGSSRKVFFVEYQINLCKSKSIIAHFFKSSILFGCYLMMGWPRTISNHNHNLEQNSLNLIDDSLHLFS